MDGAKELFTQEQQRIYDTMTPQEQLALIEGYNWALQNSIRLSDEIFR